MAQFLEISIASFFTIAIYTLPVLFAAWIFSKTFRVKNCLELLKQIKNELQRLNDFNEEKKQSQAQIG